MALTSFDSGATVTTFLAPPAGFDPFAAGNAGLDAHGIPRRPVGHPALLKQWEAIVRTVQQFIEPQFKKTNKRHGPRSAGTTAATSSNWSGAVDFAPAGSTFDWVMGRWTVPNPNPESNQSAAYYCSSWIGIDGDGSPDVFQAGVECDATNIGGFVQREVYAWWEWYPEFEIAITNFPVAPGDELFCLLTVVSPTRGKVLLSNVTRGVGTAFEIAAPTGTVLAGNCAEWIAERPGVGGAISNLADYHEVDFTNCEAHLNSCTVLQPSSGTNIDMIDNGGAIVSNGRIAPPDTVRCTYAGPVAPGPNSIASVAFPGVYLRIDGGGVTAPNPSGAGRVNCQFGIGGSGAQSYEKFQIQDLGGGLVAIASIFFPNVYLRLDSQGLSSPNPNGGGIVNCQFGIGGGGVHSYEKFRIQNLGGGLFAIESVAFPGVYLRMDGGGLIAPNPAGGGRVNCQFGIGGGGNNSYEKFRIV